MSGHWQLVYEFTGRPVGSYLSTLVLGSCLLIGGLIGLRLWIIGKRRPLNALDWVAFYRKSFWDSSRWREALVFGGIFGGSFLLVSEGIYFHQDNQLISFLQQNRCDAVAGQISSIMPEGSGGEQQFVIGNQPVVYDNHAVGFDDQLCDGVRLCAGDYGRVCMEGKWIGRIEKWVGEPDRSSPPFQ